MIRETIVDDCTGIVIKVVDKYDDGEPCAHVGCIKHVTHPCEYCGRYACMGHADVDVLTKIYHGDFKVATT